MVQSQVRFPDEIMEYIRTESSRMGIPQNSFILVLLEHGKKVWDGKVQITLSEK